MAGPRLMNAGDKKSQEYCRTDEEKKKKEQDVEELDIRDWREGTNE